MSEQQQTASWGELLSGRNGLRSLALAGGVALHAINVYIVATILPSVVADIGGLEYYAWNMALFVAASILGSALVPKMTDRLGLRKAFLVAIPIFAAATAVCASAPSMEWLLLGRTLQGLGGGILLGLCYSASRVVFEERLWSRAMALISSMWGVATLSGPAIGGIFAQAGLWRWAFWSILPVALGLAWLVSTQITPQQSVAQKQGVRVPFIQVSLLIVSVVILSLSSLVSHVIWSSLGVALGIAVALIFGWVDRRFTPSLLPQGGYRLRNGLGALYACVILLNIGITIEIFVPYFLQIIHNYSPLAAGYFCALMSAGWSVGSISTSSWSPKIIPKVMRLGPIVSAMSLVSLGLVMPTVHFSNAMLEHLVLAVSLFGVGLGVGMAWPHMMTQVFRTAPKGQETMASSAVITTQLYALAFGAAMGGLISNFAGLVSLGGVEGAVRAAGFLFFFIALAPGVAAFVMALVVKNRT